MDGLTIGIVVFLVVMFLLLSALRVALRVIIREPEKTRGQIEYERAVSPNLAARDADRSRPSPPEGARVLTRDLRPAAHDPNQSSEPKTSG